MDTVWPGTPRTVDHQNPPQALEARSRLALAGLVTVGVCTGFWAAAVWSLHGAPAGAVGLGRLRDLRASYDTWETITMVGNLLAAALFLPWFAAAYANLRRLGAQHLRYSNGWAIGSWFVPFGSIWIPKRIANAIWRGSEASADLGSESWLGGDVSPVLQWWWGLYLVGGFLAAVGTVMVRLGYWGLSHSGPRISVEGVVSLIRSGSVIAILGGALLVPAAILAVVFVLQATERLEALRRQPVAKRGAAVISCPECAELVPAKELCRYCGSPV
jgi:Domain of unknown function (DUF4328)